MKILVTVTNYSKYCQAGKRILQDAGCEIIENTSGRPFTAEELEELVGDVDGAIAGADVWSEQIFRAALKMKVLVRFGVGVDNFDLEAAKKYGITVCNCPGINTTAVAEQAVALILGLTRQIVWLNKETKEGKWPRIMMHELKSCTVGILGFGSIGRNICEKLKVFSPVLIAYDKYVDEKEAERLGIRNIETRSWDATRVDSSLLQKADRVLVDAPCSGLGVVRRKPEIKYKEYSMEMERLPKKQLAILSASSSYVKPGGTLLYSTCTVNPEENEEVVEAFLRKNPSFEKKEKLLLLPQVDGTDGFFICVMKRSESLI